MDDMKDKKRFKDSRDCKRCRGDWKKDDWKRDDCKKDWRKDWKDDCECDWKDDWKDDWKKDRKKCKKEKRQLDLICGRGLDIDFDDCRCKDRKKQVAYVEVDTRKLCEPKVKIDFSTIVFYEGDSKDNVFRNRAKIIFKLVRENQCGKELTLGEWVYSRDFDVFGEQRREFNQLETQDSFSFTFCDEIVCTDCFTYKVIAVDCSQKEIKKLEIKNSNINAILEY